MPSISAKDASGTTQTVQTLPAVGATNKAGSLPVTLATDDPLVLAINANGQNTMTNSAPVVIASNQSAVAVKTVGEYETVAASQTDQALGATGAAGDYLSGLLVVPATTSPGAVSIKDGAGSAITVFTGGATSVSNLVPFFIPLGLVSLSGAWKVTTGANASVIGVGDFT